MSKKAKASIGELGKTSKGAKLLENLRKGVAIRHLGHCTDVTPITVNDRTEIINALEDSRINPTRAWLDRRLEWYEKKESELLDKRIYSPDVLACVGVIRAMADLDMETDEDEWNRKLKMLKVIPKYHLEELPAAIFPKGFSMTDRPN